MAELNMEEMGRKVEMAFVAAAKADKEGNESSQMFQLGLAMGMLEVIAALYGREQATHIEKLAKSKVQARKVCGQI